MYEKLKAKIDSLLNRKFNKKKKYEDILKDLHRRKKELKKDDHKEHKSLDKLIKKTELLLETLHEK